MKGNFVDDEIMAEVLVRVDKVVVCWTSMVLIGSRTE
jgi:hypothetical protein